MTSNLEVIMNGLPPLFNSIGGLITTITSSITAIATAYIILYQRKIKNIVNGRMDQMLELKRSEGYTKALQDVSNNQDRTGEANTKEAESRTKTHQTGAQTNS